MLNIVFYTYIHGTRINRVYHVIGVRVVVVVVRQVGSISLDVVVIL